MPRRANRDRRWESSASQEPSVLADNEVSRGQQLVSSRRTHAAPSPQMPLAAGTV